VLARFRAQLLERWPTEVVDAVLGTGDDDLTALAQSCRGARHRSLAARSGAH
jgi:hypothetical protein